MLALLDKAVDEPLALETIPDPETREGDVVIKVACCGGCGTDVHGTSGHGLPMAPDSRFGECGGEVVAVGKGVDRFVVGDRLVAMIVIGCGKCEGCTSGIDQLCTNQFVGDDQELAEYGQMNARGAIKLPSTMSIEASGCRRDHRRRAETRKPRNRRVMTGDIIANVTIL